MFSVTLSVGSVCLAVLVSIVSSEPTFLIPQLRSEVANIVEPSSIQYQVVPNSEYAVASVQTSELSLMDYVLSPVSAVIGLGSTALSVVSWVIINGSMVLLGMAIVIGFCALTPFCTLIIEKPSFLARENLSSFPYLDELEYYITEAYNKYHEMQKSI